jgi:hypothetical protein
MLDKYALGLLMGQLYWRNVLVNDTVLHPYVDHQSDNFSFRR